MYSPPNFPRIARSVLRPSIFPSLLLLLLAITGAAQQAQLTLADLLIGLRSRKATLEERNGILAEAVRERGITFSLSPEIEKELMSTGASPALIDAVRDRSAPPKPSPTPVFVAAPVPTPTPPDFDFYKSRADLNLTKGEYSLALADYDKAVSLRADSAVAFLDRGRTHFNLKDLKKAGADFDRAIELDPKDSRAFYGRGLVYESNGELEKALSDYQKAVDLDEKNDAAKAMAAKVTGLLRAREAKVEAPQPEAPKPEPVKAPESINLGSLSSANAIKMVMPSYAPVARQANIEGIVVVEVSLDEKGNVVEAKAVSGHQFLRNAAEDAARRSRFKPAMFNNTPIKGYGTITYNFSLKNPS
ncbi:MAG TPA: TonB family protein [Pyrinomonadaceae bacterium]|nr:TonB family protein [Pyrinomonadaceae bacterium]